MRSSCGLGRVVPSTSASAIVRRSARTSCRPRAQLPRHPRQDLGDVAADVLGLRDAVHLRQRRVHAHEAEPVVEDGEPDRRLLEHRVEQRDRALAGQLELGRAPAQPLLRARERRRPSR